MEPETAERATPCTSTESNSPTSAAFQHLDFNLDRGNGEYAGWTVFTGDNGSGKSALLKAIAIALVGKDEARALQPSFRPWIREGAHEASLVLEMFWSTIVRASITLTLKNGSKPEPSLEEFRTLSAVVPPEGLTLGDLKYWFSCGYGPFRRITGASPEAVRQMAAPTTERFVTMFQESASLAEVDSWMRTLSHKALEGKPDAHAELELLTRFLNDDLMPNGIQVDMIDSDGLWLRDRKAVRLPWGEMSDGYRSALALLADILRHLIRTFGVDGLTEEKDGRIAVTKEGVVLIDEIDSHLHPEWQREIGFWLNRHFPKIQFLVTSHSPLICQAADPNGLFVLPEPGSDDLPRALTLEEYQRVIASKSDEILRSAAFGLRNTRSPLAVEKRAQYSKLKAKERVTSLTKPEQKALRQLSMFVLDEE